MLDLKKTMDYGKTFHTIASRVYSFVLGGKFVFSSIMTGMVCVSFIYFFGSSLFFFMKTKQRFVKYPVNWELSKLLCSFLDIALDKIY